MVEEPRKSFDVTVTTNRALPSLSPGALLLPATKTMFAGDSFLVRNRNRRGAFEDSESGIRLPMRPDDMRAKYKQLLHAHYVALTERLASSGADYVRVETDKPLDQALHAYLDRRLARSRVR